jgi:hypothetical protein
MGFIAITLLLLLSSVFVRHLLPNRVENAIAMV